MTLKGRARKKNGSLYSRFLLCKKEIQKSSFVESKDNDVVTDWQMSKTTRIGR